MAATTYHIELRKYGRLYFIFPPLLAFVVYGEDMLSWQGVGFMLTAIATMHVIYFWRVYQYFVVTVGDESLQLFNIMGKKEEIAYPDLVGPLVRNFGFVKYYTFVSTKDRFKQLVITNYTEKLDQCLAEIQSKMLAASSSRS